MLLNLIFFIFNINVYQNTIFEIIMTDVEMLLSLNKVGKIFTIPEFHLFQHEYKTIDRSEDSIGSDEAQPAASLIE